MEKVHLISLNELHFEFKSVCLLAVFNTIGQKSTVYLKQTKNTIKINLTLVKNANYSKDKQKEMLAKKRKRTVGVIINIVTIENRIENPAIC